MALLLAALLVMPANTPSTSRTPRGEPAGAPRLATLSIPGTPAFVKIARDILDARFALDPSLAAQCGLFDDAARLPSFSPRAVGALTRRFEADLAALRRMPWRAWDVDRQIDWRRMYGVAEEGLSLLAHERLFEHRPAAWLEPAASDYIFLLTFAPERADLRRALTERVPAMVAEMRAVAKRPTARDAAVAVGVAQGLLTTLEGEPPSAARQAAMKAVSAYVARLQALRGLPEFRIVGAAAYERRLSRVGLLPWSARALLALAQRELADVDAALAELQPRLSAAPYAGDGVEELARGLTQEKLLALYDAIPAEDRRFLDQAGVVTIPPAVGPIRSRPTPDAMVPLTGDGGSMDPPPAFGKTNVGWWNVEHFRPEWSLEKRRAMALDALDRKRTGMGPYAVHEGVPGHHLQLSLSRLNPNPLRSILQDNAMVEGWALYAEQMFWEAGGFGRAPQTELAVLKSYRFRIRRVIYDVHIECGDWTLQNGADFKSQARRGRGVVDEDILRTINWPAQLIGYFAGKQQILELREAYRKKLGPAYTERKFHDALLAEGSIPLSLIRAKLLGEPVPGV